MNIRRQKTKASAGAWTLAEVLIAALVIGFMGISLFACFTFGWVVIRTTREDLRATQILEQKLEGLRLYSWDQLTNCPTSFVDIYDPLGATNDTSGVTYYGTISQAVPMDLPAAYRDNMRIITVGISWTNNQNGTSIPHYREMQTLSAMNGIQNYLWGVAK